MMLKTIFPTALLALCSLTTHAQRDARVQLQLGNWGSPNDMHGLRINDAIVNSLGLSVEHRVSKHAFVKATIQRWAGFKGASYFPFSRIEKSANGLNNDFVYRLVNTMIDVTAGYRLLFDKHSEVYAAGGTVISIGSSYTSAMGDELTDDIPIEVKHRDFGAAWEAGYNYNFAHQRLNIGTSISGQHYAADFNLYTIKLNLGYNFNMIK